MKPSATKNRELIKQYPFVAKILDQPMEPHAWRNNGSSRVEYIDELTIKVEKADGDLMFRRACNVGLGDSSYILQFNGNRKGQVMKRGEYAFAVDKDNKIINRLNFPRNDEERRKSPNEVYAWQVLWQINHTNMDSMGYRHLNNLGYIIWVTVEAWYMDTKKEGSPDSRFGELQDRVIHIIIYSEPDEGFEKLRQNANVYQNLWLDTRVMIRGALNNDHDIIGINGMLYEMCITFQNEVYFNGMKAILDGGKFRGASGQFGAVKVLAAEMCGYDRIMLKDAMSYITFQLRPDSQNMYVLGQEGTLPQIRNLVRTIVYMWNHKSEAREAFKPDKNISVM